MSTVAPVALALARRGLPTFPCHPTSKRPLVAGGFHAATLQADQIVCWCRRWPLALPGVPTGAPSRLLVVDLDVDARAAGPEAATVTIARASLAAVGITRHRWAARTRSGGWHLFFRWRDELPGCSAGKLAGVDVRSEGGFVIAWNPEALAAAAVAPDLPEPPAALVAALIRRPEPAAVAHPMPRLAAGGDRWADAALHGEIARVVTAPEGRRNHELNRGAFALGQIIALGRLDPSTVEDALLGAALAAGLSEREARRTIGSGLTAGSRNPRQLGGQSHAR